MRRQRPWILALALFLSVLIPLFPGGASNAQAVDGLADDEVCAFTYQDRRYTVTWEECKQAFSYRMFCGYLNPQSPGKVLESELPEAKKILYEAVALKIWMLENDLIGKPLADAHVHAREMEFELYLNERLAKIPIEISESEIQEYYRKNGRLYTVPQETKIQLIHIPAEKSQAGEYSEEALKQAEAAAQATWERIRAGEDFDQVMKEVSPEGWRGELDYQPQGPRGVFIDLAVKKLEVGEVSPPIRTSQGYFIAKLLGIRNSRPMTYEEARPLIEQNLKQQAFRKNRETMISEWAIQHIVLVDPRKESELAIFF